jgi:nucleoside-diphosphate-sugar epimerase
MPSKKDKKKALSSATGPLPVESDSSDASRKVADKATISTSTEAEAESASVLASAQCAGTNGQDISRGGNETIAPAVSEEIHAAVQHAITDASGKNVDPGTSTAQTASNSVVFSRPADATPPYVQARRQIAQPIGKGSLVAVTGASGFIGSHVVRALLAEGYSVRACVRDNSPSNANNQMLLKLATGQPGSITLVNANLDAAGSYDEAFRDCRAVVHSAAVVEIQQVADPYRTIVKPAVEGTRNVLASAVASQSVLRFIMISSCIAIQSYDREPGHVFTEDDWNTWSSVENGDAYGFAKTQAEQLVWKCVEDAAKCPFDAVSINPGVVLGEVLCKSHTKSSAVLLRQAIYNNPVLNYPASYVDVKDVSQMIIQSLQMPEAGGHRFLAVSDHEQMNTAELSVIAQRLLPQYKLQSPPMYPPLKWALAKAAYHASLKTAVLNEFQVLSMEHPVKFSNQKSKRILNMNYRILGDTIYDTVTSMIDNKFITPIPRQPDCEENDRGILVQLLDACSGR